MSAQTDANYSDFSMSFMEHPVTRELAFVTDEAAVKQAVRNLLLTNFYARRFNPHLGSNLRRLLFENITSVIQSAIEDAIASVIRNWEPRAKIVLIQAIPTPDENAYNVQIVFSLLNSTAPIEVNVFLKRIR